MRRFFSFDIETVSRSVVFPKRDLPFYNSRILRDFILEIVIFNLRKCLKRLIKALRNNQNVSTFLFQLIQSFIFLTGFNVNFIIDLLKNVTEANKKMINS